MQVELNSLRNHYVKCECRICQQHKELVKHLASVGDAGLNEAVVFFERIYEDLTHAELDRDVNQAIINGSWPSSEEILAGFRTDKEKTDV